MTRLVLLVSTITLMLASLILRFQMGWHGLIPSAINLPLVLLFALVFNKFTQGPLSRRHFGLGGLVMTISLLFASIASNAGIQLAQMQIFDRMYTSAPGGASPSRGGKSPNFDEVTSAEAEPALVEILAQSLVEVSIEEITARWLVLGTLVILMPVPWALLLSSVVFAVFHTVMPILIGHPEIAPFVLAPSFAIGIFFGIAYLRYGIFAAIAIHFGLNLIPILRVEHGQFADLIMYGSMGVALILFPMVLWFSRKRSRPLFRHVEISSSVP